MKSILKTYKTIKNNYTRTENHRKSNVFYIESVTIEHSKTVIKLSKPKMYDDQLNLTRSSIKNILFEITKEFKKCKIQTNLPFMKNDEVFKNKSIRRSSKKLSSN